MDITRCGLNCHLKQVLGPLFGYLEMTTLGLTLEKLIWWNGRLLLMPQPRHVLKMMTL